METELINQWVHSRQIGRTMQHMGAFFSFMTDSPYARLHTQADVLDFALGNPHEMPLPGLAQALQKWSEPQNEDWFAYKMNEPAGQEIVARSLRRRLGVIFEPQDIFLTNGAFAALTTALTALTDDTDEIIYFSPPWFFYAPMIVSRHGRPVALPCDPLTHEPDLRALRRALNNRTRAVIVNTPNNPTGRIYSPDLLRELGMVLSEASERATRPVYLLSDESYSRIVYDGRAFHSPAEFYHNTLLIYTYGKTLLAPGQRIGYIALPAAMAVREQLRPALLAAQLVNGYAFPNALMQHALADLEKLSIDIPRLQARRDRMVAALRGMGYQLNSPEGTFYLLVQSPLADDGAFIQLLSEEKILCLPGSTYEMPGTFRISLTASDEMVERALPGFERALARAKAGG
jgi:aspartate aminotransferase